MVFRAILCTLLLAGGSSPAFARTRDCWSYSYGCWMHAGYDYGSDTTNWSLSCDDGGFYYGSMGGDETPGLCG